MSVDIWWYEKRQQWVADVPSIENPGKRKRLYLGADESQARQKMHSYMARYHAADTTEPTNSDTLSLFALVARFLSWAETNLSEATQDMYRIQLKNFTEQHGRQHAAEITPQQVEAEKAAIRERGCKPRTINFFVQSIKRLYNWAVEQGLLDESPIKNVKRVPKAPPQDRSLDQETVDQFLHYAKESQPLADFCEVLLNTGMRVGELLKLEWGYVDFERQIARVYDHKTASRGEQRPRTIPLNDRVAGILQRQAEVVDVVFTGEKGQPLTYDALKSRKDRLEREHEDMPHVTFHQFRHTCATRLAQSGVPERVAQEILGHSSTLMTRYYTTTSTDEMLDAVNRLNDQGPGEAE